jgi:hypothetical protein
MVLYKETSTKYIWQALTVTEPAIQNSINLKDLLPSKQYHVRLLGSIFGIIEESRLITFVTKDRKYLKFSLEIYLFIYSQVSVRHGLQVDVQ